MVSTAFKTISFAASLLALTNGVQAQVTATFPNGVTNPDVSRRWVSLVVVVVNNLIADLGGTPFLPISFVEARNRSTRCGYQPDL